ncbi:acyl-CoA dehydrogenase family protein [Streptomyces sp. NBC_01304]|uniref:acyl-CoA dehydrogenase family protein n=1 Tax=Streptomyces sp. NBC_01304 TaxID=2903818 RepID=UPI002E12D3BA|nr:acyl-CoA/acyl-ACP dehydrogenase [Streptomyces sp. NBC_01304]
MRFLLDPEQREFGRTLSALLSASDTPSVVRAWGAGDFTAGRALWARLGEAGVFSLAVPEEYDGVGPLPVELAVAFVELGRAAVPGPAAETVGASALLAALGDPALAKRWLPGIASGETMASLALPGGGPYALDADAASVVFFSPTPPLPEKLPPASKMSSNAGRADESRPAKSARPAFEDAPGGRKAPQDFGKGRGGEEIRLAPDHGPVHASADPARRLARPAEGGELLAEGEQAARAIQSAQDWTTFATAAQALGVGEALLAQTVAYVKQRTQFGTAIGTFQAVKHQLADAHLRLEFAKPLLFGAALTMTRADIAAAKVTATEAAYAASRTALQLHGAVGYTQELDLSLWIRKAQALRTAWGTPAECRARVLEDHAHSTDHSDHDAYAT